MNPPDGGPPLLSRTKMNLARLALLGQLQEEDESTDTKPITQHFDPKNDEVSEHSKLLDDYAEVISCTG